MEVEVFSCALPLTKRLVLIDLNNYYLSMDHLLNDTSNDTSKVKILQHDLYN